MQLSQLLVASPLQKALADSALSHTAQLGFTPAAARMHEDAFRVHRLLSEALPSPLERQLSLVAGLQPTLEHARRFQEILAPMATMHRRIAEHVERHTAPLREQAAVFRLVGAKSPLGLNPALEALASSAALQGEVFRQLDRIRASSFTTFLEQPGYRAAMHGWLKETSGRTLGFEDTEAEEFAAMVESQAVALATADVGASTIAASSAVDLTAALLAALGPLGRHPVVQGIVMAFIAAMVTVEYEQFRTRGDQVAELSEERRQTALLESIHQALADNGTHGDPTVPYLAARATRNAHVRQAPTRSSRSLGVLEEGDDVLVLGRSGDWLRVMASLPDGELQAGWVYIRLVKASR